MWFRLGKNGKLIFLGLGNVRIVLYVYILSKILGQNHCKFFLVFFQSNKRNDTAATDTIKNCDVFPYDYLYLQITMLSDQ